MHKITTMSAVRRTSEFALRFRRLGRAAALLLAAVSVPLSARDARAARKHTRKRAPHAHVKASPTPSPTPGPKTVQELEAELRADEPAVWRAVLEAEFPDPKAIVSVVSSTATDSNRGHHDLWRALRYLRIEMRDLQEATCDDFEEHNVLSHPLPKAEWPRTVQLVSWKPAPLNMDEWHKFHVLHPKSTAFAILSRVGFSPDRNQALAYLEYACGDWCGGGRYYLLDATADADARRWTVERTYRSWDFQELWSAPPPPADAPATATDEAK